MNIVHYNFACKNKTAKMNKRMHVNLLNVSYYMYFLFEKRVKIVLVMEQKYPLLSLIFCLKITIKNKIISI